MATLELYKMETCPFCRKVMSFMDEHHLDQITRLDVNEHPEYREALIEKGGQNQVPALSIDGEILYESDDIISWMKTHLLDEEADEPSSSDEPPVCPVF